MSPLFCAVAKRPSSEPVRREYAATSGVSATTRSISTHLAIGVCQGAALGRQVVEDEAAFVRRGKEAGADTREQNDASEPARRAPSQPRSAGRRDHHAEHALVCLLEAAVPFARGPMAAPPPSAPSAATTLTASASEISTATESDIESARKNWPGTPDSRPSGAKTTTVVSVELTSGPVDLRHRARGRSRRLRQPAGARSRRPPPHRR